MTGYKYSYLLLLKFMNIGRSYHTMTGSLHIVQFNLKDCKLKTNQHRMDPKTKIICTDFVH